MALGINTNVASLSAQNELNSSKATKNEALERLSSGLRINSASDDAAGLAISTRFEAQINGLDQASRNANDAISLTQTAEGALEETTNSLQRVRELAVQAANGTNTDSDRASLQNEVSELTDEIQRRAETTQFNGQNILDGSFDGKQFQVGANKDQTINVSISDASADSLAANASGESSGVNRRDFGTTAFAAPTTFEINGTDVTGELSDDGLSSVEADSSAAAFAQAINAVSDTTGVTAEANETTENLGTISADSAGLSGGNLEINGQQINVSEVTAGDSDGALRDAINDVSNLTGVEASLDSDNKLELTAEDGRNIQLTTDGGGNSGTFGNFATGGGSTVDVVTTGTVTYQSDEQISVNFSDSGDGAGQTGFAGQSVTTGNSVREIDVSTVGGANKAIEQVDRALSQVNDIRSELGATQNRFDSTISNLETSSENLSAANSRIRDADFAAESAKLQKANVLQQAGISVLAQANQAPQQALSLLQ